MSERNECDDVADSIARAFPDQRFRTFDEAARFVREQMPDETETVIDNVAQRLFEISPAEPRFRLCWVDQRTGDKRRSPYALPRDIADAEFAFRARTVPGLVQWIEPAEAEEE